jgi:hypothetical protein
LLWHHANCLFTRAHRIILCCCSQRITRLSHPPTLGWGPGGQPYSCCQPDPRIFFSTFPGQPCKSDLPSVPLLSYCPVVPLLCSLLVSLCWAGSIAVPQRLPRRGETNSATTANEGPVRIQYKCLVPIYVFPEMKLLFPKQNNNILFPSSYAHISVRDLNTSRIGLPILLQGNMWTDPGNILITHRHMHVN